MWERPGLVRSWSGRAEVLCVLNSVCTRQSRVFGEGASVERLPSDGRRALRR